MISETILQQADKAYQSHHYGEALKLYQNAVSSNIALSDEQLFRLSKLLFESGEAVKAFAQIEKISTDGQENFDIDVLHYKLKKELKVPEEELIATLEKIFTYTYDDELMFELAVLYSKNNLPSKSKRICKQIINVFRSGQWVDKAKKLLESNGILSDTIATVNNLYPYKCNMPVVSEIEKSNTENKANDLNKTGESKVLKNDFPDFLKDAFDGMIGLESVKQELNKIYNFIKIERLRSEKLGIQPDSDMSYSFVLYGNPGTGKTTVARIIGKMLFALGIRKKDVFVEVDRKSLVAEYIGETAKQTLKAVDLARGGTLFIDEAYSLYEKDNKQDFGREAINTLLKDMEDNRSDYSVIIAGYREQMNEMLNHANPGFRSRFKFHIDIPNYSDDELIEIAHSMANKKHYVIDVSGDMAIRKSIEKERIDETFGNARFIRDLIEKSILNMSERLANSTKLCNDDLLLLKAEDIYIENGNDAELDVLVKELDSLVGLIDAKKRVHEILDVIYEKEEAKKRGLSVGDSSMSMHMAFKGNAGTGKTTVARLMGKILGKMGILKRADVFVECKREDLVGTYIGQTEEKTKEVIRSAMGGVLFVDEAYTLVRGRSGNDFGVIALETLMTAMENHRAELVVILAGYTKEIDELIASNAGLRRRIAYDIFFEDYSIDEMTDIFFSMVFKEGLQISDDLRENVRSLLKKESQIPDFGNAGGVRNVFEKVKTQKAKRKKIKDEDFISIYAEDLEGV